MCLFDHNELDSDLDASDMFGQGETEVHTCPDCRGEMEMSPSCGVFVCVDCDRHEGLARCFCGWSGGTLDLGDGEIDMLEEDFDWVPEE